MNYRPGSLLGKDLTGYLTRELENIAQASRENAPSVLYRTMPANQGSLTAAVSANYKIASGNVLRISTSATVTLTGLAYKEPFREVVLLNVGTGVLTLKSEDSASSASYRFRLSQTLNLSADAAVMIWYDPYSHRHRCIGRT
jgi:subtilisin family serine protease